MFLDRLLDMLDSKRITKNKFLQDLGLGKNSFLNWKERGNIPSGETLIKIADYLDCSVDYLLGRTDTIAKINSHNTIRGNNNIIGNGNSIGERLSEQETALLGLFKKFDVVKQARLLAYAAELDKEV